MLSVRPRILCIEDDPDICDLLSIYLAEEFDLALAASLTEARRIISLDQVELLIVDDHFPDGHGLDFIRELRSKNIQTPIIHQSSDAYPDQIQAGIDAGSNVYLTKPFDMDELVAIVRRMIDSVRQ